MQQQKNSMYSAESYDRIRSAYNSLYVMHHHLAANAADGGGARKQALAVSQARLSELADTLVRMKADVPGAFA